MLMVCVRVWVCERERVRGRGRRERERAYIVLLIRPLYLQVYCFKGVSKQGKDVLFMFKGYDAAKM